MAILYYQAAYTRASDRNPGPVIANAKMQKNAEEKSNFVAEVEILYDNMKQVVIKWLLKQEDSTLNRQFEDFAGFYGFKPILCWPYRGQTKGKAERTVQFVRDNFMVGIKYNALADLNR